MSTPEPAGSVRIGLTVLPHGRGLPLPSKATSGSSGVDLRAALADDLVIQPGGRSLVPTGLIVEIPEGWEWQVRPRSGLAARDGLTVLNSPGTVDSDYRGEVKVILVNLGDRPVTLQRGDRIAQAVLARVADAELVERDGLGSTERGEGGFGHTGHS